MAQPKYKIGATVTILRHDLQKQYVGKKAIVKKAFQLTNDDLQDQFVYRLECDGETLKGVTPELDLE